MLDMKVKAIVMVACTCGGHTVPSSDCDGSIRPTVRSVLTSLGLVYQPSTSNDLPYRSHAWQVLSSGCPERLK